MEILLVLLILIQGACLVALVLLFRHVGNGAHQGRALEEMQTSLQDARMRLAVLGEQMENLRPLALSVNHIRDGITEVKSRIRAREEIELRTADAIRRLEMIIAGTHTKGVAGEQLLDTVFSRLPPEWQVRDLVVGNKRVEFGLRLPNGLILPIDSKWTATHLIEQFTRTDDAEERQKLKAQIERTVLERMNEVRKYIDANLTVSFAVAVVPDAVFELCASLQAEAFSNGVVLVGYSLFLPYLLLVFQAMLKASQQIDHERLCRALEACERIVVDLQNEVESRWGRAMTMLDNSRRAMAAGLSQIRGELTSLRFIAEPGGVSEEGKDQE